MYFLLRYKEWKISWSDPWSNFKIDQEVEKIIADAYSESKKIINDNKDMVEKIVAKLLEKETIFSEDFKKIVNGDDNVADNNVVNDNNSNSENNDKSNNNISKDKSEDKK